MASIGSLAVQLIMNKEGFSGGLAQAQKESEVFVSNIRKTLTQQKLMGDLKDKLKAEMNPPGLVDSLKSGLGGALGAVGIGGIGAAGAGLAVKSGIDDVVNIGKDAARFGIPIKSMVTLMNVGASESEKFGKGLEKLVEAIGETAGGSREYLPVLKQLGISQREFVGMRADTAYLRVAEGIKRMDDVGQRSVISQKLMGKAGDDLIPILARGKEGWDASTAAVERHNLAFTQAEYNQARLAKASMKNMEDAWQGFKQRIAIKVSPIVAAAGETAPEKTWSQLLNPFDLSLSENFIKRAEQIKAEAEKTAAKTGPTAAQKGAADLAAAVGALETKFKEQSDTSGKSARQIEIWKLQVGGASTAAMKNVNAIDAQLTALEKLNAVSFAGLNIFDAFRMKTEALDRGMTSGTITAAQRTSELARLRKEMEMAQTNKAWQMFAETRTPLEQFQSHMAEIEQQYQTGAIGSQIYARSVANLVTQMEKAANIGPVQSPSALVAGTSAAADAMAQFRNEARTKGQSQQERVTTLLSELKNQNSIQIQQAQELLQAVKDQGRATVIKVP